MLPPVMTSVRFFTIAQVLQRDDLFALKFGKKALCCTLLKSCLNLVLFPSLPDEASGRNVVEIVFVLPVIVIKK